jgi:hypothetical protein
MNTGQIGRAGDPLPPFENNMVRQRVDDQGRMYELAPESTFPGCTMDKNLIGWPKEDAIRIWMRANREWDSKFAVAKARGKQPPFIFPLSDFTSQQRMNINI